MPIEVHSLRDFSLISSIKQKMVCNVEDLAYQQELIRHLDAQLRKSPSYSMRYFIEELESVLKSTDIGFGRVFYVTMICRMHDKLLESLSKQASAIEIKEWFNSASSSLFENSQHLVSTNTQSSVSTAGALVITRQLIKLAKEFNYDEFRLRSRASSLAMKLENLEVRNGAMLLCQ